MLLIPLCKLSVPGPVRQLCSRCRPQFAGKFARPPSLAPPLRTARCPGRPAAPGTPSTSSAPAGSGPASNGSTSGRARWRGAARPTGCAAAPATSTRPACPRPARRRPAAARPGRPAAPQRQALDPFMGITPLQNMGEQRKTGGRITRDRVGTEDPDPPGGVHDDAPDWCDQGRRTDATGERRGKVSCPSCSTAARSSPANSPGLCPWCTLSERPDAARRQSRRRLPRRPAAHAHRPARLPRPCPHDTPSTAPAVLSRWTKPGTGPGWWYAQGAAGRTVSARQPGQHQEEGRPDQAARNGITSAPRRSVSR